MAARGAILSDEGVDLTVSVHMNMFSDRSVSGPMVFYMEGSQEGEKLAGCVIESVCEAIGHPARPANPGDYYVLRAGSAPGIIVECGFLSNAQDEALLLDPVHQQKLANGIAAGVLEYLGE